MWDFPGGPVVKTPHFHFRGHEFDPWSEELRSCMPTGGAEGKKKKRRKVWTNSPAKCITAMADRPKAIKPTSK